MPSLGVDEFADQNTERGELFFAPDQEDE